MMSDLFAAVLWIGLSALNVVLLAAVLVILLGQPENDAAAEAAPV